MNFIGMYAALGLSLAILNFYRAYRAMFFDDYGNIKTEKRKQWVEKQRKELEEIKRDASEFPVPLVAALVALVFSAGFIATFALWPIFLVRKVFQARRRG